MTIGQMENLVTVAEAGSFSAAAEKLYISPQALIQQVAKMENELGFKIFIRNSKGVLLSPGGEEYYRGVKAILSQYRACTERAARKARQASTLRIGLPEGVNPEFLLSVCQAFQEQHPDITLRYERLSRQNTIKALLNRKIDIGAQIRLEEEVPYYSEKLFPVAHYCLVSRGSALADKDSIDLPDLRGKTIGFWGPPEAYRSLVKRSRDLNLDIQFRNVQEDFSESLVFCMAGNVLLASAPVISYLKSSLTVIPVSFSIEQSYYLSYTQKDNEAVHSFLCTAREAAAAETHPWKQTLSGLTP